MLRAGNRKLRGQKRVKTGAFSREGIPGGAKFRGSNRPVSLMDTQDRQLLGGERRELELQRKESQCSNFAPVDPSGGLAQGGIT